MTDMQPYDDAELDAIAVVRLAVAESERGEMLSTTLHRCCCVCRTTTPTAFSSWSPPSLGSLASWWDS